MHHRFTRTAAAATSLFGLLLAGCGGVVHSPSTGVSLSGNWQVSATTASARTLPLFSGELSGSADTVTGVLHPSAASACLFPAAAFPVSGAVANGVLTLSGQLAPGSTLNVSGILAPDGQSLTAATYSVSAGACATAGPVAVLAHAFTPISGTYTGSFADPGGQAIAIDATLSQTPSADTSGNFQLSGTATFPQNPCFASPVSIASSQVTGGSFTLTYTDSQTTNSVTASGTFSSDATTLTVTSWSLSGPCGTNSGTGLLTQHT